ncbi:MAG: S1 RNA-binding domain-containing protein, partial [Oscillospiraceae bacterium]|nr:S1 RNA-binding domain-containing protein [Oscillospiraceae bacterium]
MTQIEVGAILDGTVSSIAKFGAFVNLPERRSGLVHISEIASEYVADVNDFLQVGQAVKVKVLAVTPEGKINLSIKRAQPEPERAAPERRAPRPQTQRSSAPRSSAGTPMPQGVVYGSTGDAS